jgi:hypothetical protein
MGFDSYTQHLFYAFFSPPCQYTHLNLRPSSFRFNALWQAVFYKTGFVLLGQPIISDGLSFFIYAFLIYAHFLTNATKA